MSTGSIVGTEVLAGLVGNSLFLLSIRKARNCKANTFTLMASLSAVDILTSLTLGVGFLREFLLTNFASQEMMCQYGLFISASCISCNALHILCMAVDRYAAIAFPHRSVLLFNFYLTLITLYHLLFIYIFKESVAQNLS